MNSEPSVVITYDDKRRPGRPHLDGSPPGEGEYLKRIAVTLSGEDADLLEALGLGNRSEGVRQLVELYRKFLSMSAPADK